MDELNNHQMILLTGLVSFVTSIATGIITVGLLQSSPQTVTQTVNRVVEKTIERVVPDQGKSTSEPTTITNEVTKEVTVYAKEDDLVVATVEKNRPRVVAIYAVGTATGTKAIGTGFVVSRDGLVVTALSNLLSDGALAEVYSVSIGEAVYAAKLIDAKNIPKGLAFLQLDIKTKLVDAVSFGKIDPKVGQTVVVLGGDDNSSIFKTTLSRLVNEKADSSTSSPIVLSSIETTPRIPEGNNGALIANLDGVVVGMCVWSEVAARNIILPAERILDAINSLSQKPRAEAPVEPNAPQT